MDLYLNEEGISNTISLDWWEETSAIDSLEVACVPAQHFSARGMFDRNKTLWAGYVLKTTQGNIYFAGDSGYGTFFKEIGDKYGPMKASLIPIGAYQPLWFMSPVHINPTEALQVHKDVQSEFTIGMHYGTFPLADDGQMEPVNDFRQAKSDENFMLLDEGKSLVVEPSVKK